MLLGGELHLTLWRSLEQYPTSGRCQPCLSYSVKIMFGAGREGGKQQIAQENQNFSDIAMLSHFGQSESYTDRPEKTHLSLHHYRFKLLIIVDTDGNRPTDFHGSFVGFLRSFASL